MRRRAIWIVGLFALALIGASAAAIAGLGDDDSNGNVTIVRDPPAGGGCYCPAIWDPVVCKDADGGRHHFSNACVAACHGYTHCASIARPTIQ